MSNTGALTQVLLCFSLRKWCQTFIWWWMFSNLWKALQCDPRWLLKSMFQMCRISMTDGCHMATWERAEKGTILTRFLSNMTPWSSGEGRHMVYKRQCSQRSQIKCRTSGTPRFDSHHGHFLCCVPDQEVWFPAYTKAEKQGEEGIQVVPILTEAESLQHTNPNKTLYRNHSVNRFQGRCSPRGLHLSSVVRGCSGDAASLSGSCHAWGAWSSYRFRLAWRASVTAVQVFS